MVLTLQKVLISDEVDNQCVDVLRASGIEVDKNTKLSKDQLIAEIPVGVSLIEHDLFPWLYDHTLQTVMYQGAKHLGLRTTPKGIF